MTDPKTPAVRKTLPADKPLIDRLASLEGMPPEPPKRAKKETLFIAYDMVDTTGFVNIAVFGVKVDALEFAMDQEPVWRVVTTHKGETLRDAVAAAKKSNEK